MPARQSDFFRKTIQGPIKSSIDLRDMVRQYLISRGLACMEKAAKRRSDAVTNNRKISEYREIIRTSVCNFYGELPVGNCGKPLEVTCVSAFDKEGYRIENVLFQSFPGWQVNATIYVPLNFKPPFPAVVVPVGHSGKQFKSYQLPCQLFARSGYLAVVFDPPGQAGEKQPGNDHFIDGVRCYLVGQTSSQYFVADALRCIDYLETRGDADLSRGVCMTGVSGGGTTTTIASLLDERIAVIGPSCCVTQLADIDITQCYAGCPETHMWARYAKGIDEVDLLCAFGPKPMLLMAGEFDEVFRIDDTRELAKKVAMFYETLGKAESFEFFVDGAGHCYSLTQAREFVKFMNRHLLGDPNRPVCDLPDSAYELDSYEQLKCHPRTDVNMRSLAIERANSFEKLEKSRCSSHEKVRSFASLIAGVTEPAAAPQVQAGQPFQVWTHHWQQLLLKPERGIELPATFLYSLDSAKSPAATIVHFDNKHRHRLLHSGGLLTRAMRVCHNDSSPGINLLSVDLRGWGDSSPAMYPYESASWGSTDRYLSYTTAAIGDSIMAMRIRDALAAIAYLRTRDEVDPTKIIITGCGLAGIVALHAAAIDNNVAGVLVWDTLASFKSLLETENYAWLADAFIPNVLLHYDMPELIDSISQAVRVLNPLDGAANSLPTERLDELNRKLGREVFFTDSDEQSIVSGINSF